MAAATDWVVAEAGHVIASNPEQRRRLNRATSFIIWLTTSGHAFLNPLLPISEKAAVFRENDVASCDTILHSIYLDYPSDFASNIICMVSQKCPFFTAIRTPNDCDRETAEWATKDAQPAGGLQKKMYHRHQASM